MAKQIDEGTKITLDLKTIGIILFFVQPLLVCGLLYNLIFKNFKELPESPISRTEYDLKDELIHQTILDTQDDVEKILEDLEKIDQRLYELQKDN